MSNLISELRTRAEEYWQKWESYRVLHELKEFKPCAIAFKAQGINHFNRVLSVLLQEKIIDQCHIGFVDKRYIASLVLDEPIFQDIYIIKLMQRRPNSTDPVGLDHFDFYTPKLKEVESYFKSKKLSNWVYESNESHQWMSLKFNKTEAKFVDHLVLDVSTKELRDVSNRIGFKPINL